MHDCDDLRDDWVRWARYSPTETDDGYHACRVSFEMCNILFWRGQKIQCNDFALVVLEIAIALDLLYANTLMHELSLDAESFSLWSSNGVHVYEVVLT
jgi:hypothetical protein